MPREQREKRRRQEAGGCGVGGGSPACRLVAPSEATPAQGRQNFEHALCRLCVVVLLCSHAAAGGSSACKANHAAPAAQPNQGVPAGVGRRLPPPLHADTRGHGVLADGMVRLRGGGDVLPSMLVRCPRDSMSLARRQAHALTFNEAGFPNLTLSQEEGRLIHDEVVEWSWRQCRVRYEQRDERNATIEREAKVALTDQELLDMEVLHYLLVHAHPELASEWMTQVGIDGTAYVRADDPFQRQRIRPLQLDKHLLLNGSLIETRRRLREAVEGGRMLRARRILDRELGLDFFGAHPELLLRLCLQHVVELVRRRRYDLAVEFLQVQVAPLAEANPGFLVDVERTMLVISVDQEAAGKSMADETAWLLSTDRRYELFRSINDRILRLADIEPRDMIEESEYLHAHLDDGVRRLVHAAEALVAEDPGNETRVAILASYKSWRDSLFSLGDVIHQREQRWRDLMARVEAGRVVPDDHIQGIIEQAWQELAAPEEEDADVSAGPASQYPKA